MTSSDSTAIMRQAYELAGQGQMPQAAVLCGEVLRQDTENAEAWLLRTVISIQAGDEREAANAARRSLLSDSRRAPAHALLGDALLSGQPQQALDSYEAALLLDNGLISAHFGRGNALLALQRPDQALASYDQVLQRRPDDAETLLQRGNALFALRDYPGAAASYDRVIALRPWHAAALSNRGAALLALRKTDAALASLDAALSIEPDLAEAHIGHGDALLQMRRPTDAMVSFQRALALHAHSPAARRGLGDAFLECGRPADALAAHQEALRQGPELPDVHNSIGNSLRALGRHAEAVAAYDESLRLDSSNATVHSNRAHVLLQVEDRVEEALEGYARALELEGDTPFAAGSLLYAQICRADWSVRAPRASRDEILRSVQSGKAACMPFAFLSMTDSAAAQLECARVFTRVKCLVERSGPRSARRRHDRRRIAYVSADLREHAISYLIAGVIERHDRQRFEVYGISLRPPQSGVMGERIRAAFDRFIDVSDMTDLAVADLMRDLEIDIAVDLNGYTQGSRPQIFAYRAAPIHVGYLGYPGTTGAQFMDYVLADDFVIPPEKRRNYSEAVVHLPDSFQANDDKRAISERVFSCSDLGLGRDAFIFCCFNNTHKINPQMFDLWMRILAEVPEGVLWLLSHAGVVCDNLRREAAGRGIDPGRLVFAERLPYSEHLARLKIADLFLDTVPFNAGTTASDALWVGVPVLTLCGEAFAARMAGSLLRTAGAAELITYSAEEYLGKAIELARSPAALTELRGRLAKSRESSPLFDTARFTAHLEAAYDEMWMRLERGEMPGSFTVCRHGLA